MTYKIPIVGYDTPPLTKNTMPRNPFALAAKQKKIKAATLLACRALRLPKGLTRVEVLLHYCPRTVQARRDEDGLAPTLSPALDALVDYGMFADDDHRIVRSGQRIEPVDPFTPLHWYGMGGRQPARLWLEVEDLSPASPVVSGDRPTPPPDTAA